MLHPRREEKERDEEAKKRQRQGSSPLLCLSALSLELHREQEKRAAALTFAPSVTLLSASFTIRWRQRDLDCAEAWFGGAERRRARGTTWIGKTKERWRLPPVLLAARRLSLSSFFPLPETGLLVRYCPCASACSTIQIDSALSFRGKGHQLSRGSLGKAPLLTSFTISRAVGRRLDRLSSHAFPLILLKTKKQTGPLLRHRPPQPAGRPRGPQAQAQEARPKPQLVLHGRQVPRLLPDHGRVLQLADGRRLPGVLGGAVHSHGREGAADRGVLVQEEGRLER